MGGDFKCDLCVSFSTENTIHAVAKLVARVPDFRFLYFGS